MTDQEFSNYAVKVLASLGLVFMLLVGLICIVLPDSKSINDGEHIDYNMQLMLMQSDVHRAELLDK